MNCRYITILAAGLALSFIGNGCIAPDPEPQKRDLAPSPAKVMSKDIYDVAPAVNKELGGAKYYTLFANISEPGKSGYSVSIVQIPPGDGLALHTLTSSEMILVFSGGGTLKVNNIAYILKEGMAVYIPPSALQSTINDTPGQLKFISIISPAYSGEKILSPPPKPIPVDALKDLAPNEENPQLKGTVDMATPATATPPAPNTPAAAANTLLQRDPLTVKNVNLSGVQQLTPQEQQVPVTPNN